MKNLLARFLPHLEADSGTNPVAAVPATPPVETPPAEYTPSTPSINIDTAAVERDQATIALRNELAALQAQVAEVRATKGTPAPVTPAPSEPDYSNDPALAEVVALKKAVAEQSAQLGALLKSQNEYAQRQAQREQLERHQQIKQVANEQVSDWLKNTVIPKDPELTGNDPRSTFLRNRLTKDVNAYMAANFNASDDPVRVRTEIAQLQARVAQHLRELKADLPPLQPSKVEVAQTLHSAASNNLSAPSTPAPSPAAPVSQNSVPARANMEQFGAGMKNRMLETLRARGVKI